MELSKVLDDNKLECDSCKKQVKLRKIIATSENSKELILCKDCRKTLLSILKIELMS